VPLRVELALGGSLRGVQRGADLAFLDAGGAPLLTYRSLRAWDTTGRELPATMQLVEGRIVLSIDADAAIYPLTIDPLVQQAYLKASNTEASDTFGSSVAIAGDTIVVGAPNEDSAATGVNGDQADNRALSAGAAYVFVRSNGFWSQQAYLKASNTGTPDGFGSSVAIAGDTIVVGAPIEASAATGVNGDQADNSVPGAGAAYVFVRSNNSWSQQAYLKASNTDAPDLFGTSVAIAGDTIVVGADGEASAATGVNGDQADNSAPQAGAAYVFVRSGSTWSQQAYLKASNTGAPDAFGTSVAIAGDTIVVGAPIEANSTGMNGNQSDNSALGAGAAYVFVRSNGSWSQQAYFKASNIGGQDRFGTSVAIGGDMIVVGAPFESSGATGVNGDQADNSAPQAGAAYVFVRSKSSWSQQTYLKASNTGADDRFGSSVAIAGDTIVVGAPYEDSAATGVNGNQSDNSSLRSGAAYVFVRSNGFWSQQAYLKASNTGGEDTFGSSVAVSGDTIIVGARAEDSAATGVNGDQTDNSAFVAGAAYTYIPAATPPSVTIAQAADQADPATSGPIRFSVIFSEPVTGFTAGDVVLSGTAPGALTATLSGSGTTYTVSVSGMSGSGTVMATIPAGAAQDAMGNLSLVAISTDDTVTFDVTPPSVTIAQAADQVDPTASGPIRFSVIFSEPVTGFTAGDVVLNGTAPGTLTATVGGSGTTYTVSVSGMSGPGTVTATIPAGAAQDVAGNMSLAATSTDDTVAFDGTPPSVTIAQAADQADPATSGPIRFSVIFSEPVTGFTAEDVVLSGTAPGALTATVGGSGTTYTVSVGGMSGPGTVTAAIPAGAAQDAAGNLSLAAISTDDTVTFAPPVTGTRVYLPLIRGANR
jgi:hypothetical protein